MDLCLSPDRFDRSNGGGGGGGAADGAFVASVADFAQLYTERPTALMLLCEFVVNRCGCDGGWYGMSGGGCGCALVDAAWLIERALALALACCELTH